jgi:hypothetical protein
MLMANVTYLFGAGASANCLPTYMNFSKRFESFRDKFIENSIWVKNLQPDLKHCASEIKRIADIIVEELKFHNTPDTIAKKYYHSKSESSDLENLKRILILYLLYEQTLDQTTIDKQMTQESSKQLIDKRYDAFIAALLRPFKGKLQFYNQFKILTWNYDSQFEIAYSRYNTDMFIPRCQRFIQSWPALLPDGSENFTIDKFSIIHLNGIAYAKTDSSRGNKDLLGSFFDISSPPLEDLTKIYRSMTTSGIPGDIGGPRLLSFAWERQNEDESIKDNGILNKAIEVATQTQILVIIGYSFPIFNNFIDKKLFEKMTMLRKVYIQSPNANDIKNILSDFPNVSPQKVNDVGYTSQFYIPPEWNKDFPSFN